MATSSTPASQPQSQATDQLSRIPFGVLIGEPLNAAVKAQATAANTSVEFIRSVGFNEVKGKPDYGDVRTVTFQYEKEVGNDIKSYKVTVPLLTIVPIPFIRIEEMNISFKANLEATSSSSEENKKSREGGLQANASGFLGKILGFGLSGGFSSKKDSTSTRDSKYSVEYTMDINVNAVQDDMPKGIGACIEHSGNSHYRQTGLSL